MTTPSHPSPVAVVTPWYPGADHAFRGAFVRAMVDATGPGTDMTVYHCEEWGHRLDGGPIEAAYQSLLSRTHRPPHAIPTAGGARLIHTPVPLTVSPGYAAIGRRHAETLSAVLDGKPLPAPVVHAHVGLQGGWGALRNKAPDARLFVTEHATFLGGVLAQPEAKEMYDELLTRCAGFFAVGAAVSDPLIKAFPHHRDKIRLMPNPVSFDVRRPKPVTDLRRWLYVGSLTERKGVRWVLEAFARCRAEDETLELTLVGDGELRRPLGAKVQELGLTDAVTFLGLQPPDRALDLMREHDLLVHNSRFETFGMTIVEASAAGMPVLVTRCGGPEETLAGIEEDAGEMIDVEEASDALVAGFRRLRDRFPDKIDLGRARHRLESRYGYAATAEAHHRAWFGDTDD
ncbi:glycosyltransferase [Actinoplanes sp. NPDC051470]|uniref:glycosyltransferase n=1 Tax=Actinoplanes sp. NPDC051470 TaxID=3157224 RepID=UPI00342A63CF